MELNSLSVAKETVVSLYDIHDVVTPLNKAGVMHMRALAVIGYKILLGDDGQAIGPMSFMSLVLRPFIRIPPRLNSAMGTLQRSLGRMTG
jgi:hypothetical protein